MILPPEDIERFYRIWFNMLHFVNEQQRLVPFFPATREQQVPVASVVTLRDALWADDELREQFLTSNPAGLPPADLEIVASWQYRVPGRFFIFRYLKKHTIFLSSTQSTHAYGVLGLVSPIEDLIGPYLPVAVDAVLLPYEGRIMYDSLLAPYNMTFGPGIRSSFRESYRDTREREGVITALLPEVRSPVAARADLQRRNAGVLTAFRKELARSTMGFRTMQQHVETIDGFGRWLLAEEPARSLLEWTCRDLDDYLGAQGSKPNPVSFRRFVRFLAATRRLERTNTDDLLELLRQ